MISIIFVLTLCLLLFILIEARLSPDIFLTQYKVANNNNIKEIDVVERERGRERDDKNIKTKQIKNNYPRPSNNGM